MIRRQARCPDRSQHGARSFRSGVLSAILLLTASSGETLTQEASATSRGEFERDAPEEVVVRGRRVGELRLEVELAKQRAYDVFNDINRNDEFDVTCTGESRTGSRLARQVCRARFENRISAAAAREYMSSLSWSCARAPESTQACMFSGASSGAIAAAKGAEAQAGTKRQELTEEIVRLANENEEFAQAILDWYEANQKYEEARKRGND